MKRVLLLATTTGYQTRSFGEAATRLGVALVFATDRCDQLEDPWVDGAIPIRFHQEAAAVEAIVAAAASAPIHGVLALGDRPTVIAAHAARRLGLRGHSPEAAAAARDKRLMREVLRHAGLPVAPFSVVARHANPNTLATELSWPVVIKPVTLSGSRGVIRADNLSGFVLAFERLHLLLDADDIRAMHDQATDHILIEGFIEGREFALEGILEDGTLHTLAIFDKPDPLDGPFFEETIYLTPSRIDPATQARLTGSVAEAARALGLEHGPVHAECRMNGEGVFVLEVAARPIGGLCARALHFNGPNGERASLEELLLRHALGDPVAAWTREREASGVMMIPIPAGGIFRRVEGVADAARVDGMWDVSITAKPDQPLVPLPEGSSYLGFLFAKGRSADAVEASLREAHARLSFVIDRRLPVL